MQSYALWLVLLWVNTVAPQQALPVGDTVVIELRDSRCVVMPPRSQYTRTERLKITFPNPAAVSQRDDSPFLGENASGLQPTAPCKGSDYSCPRPGSCIPTSLLIKEVRECSMAGLVCCEYIARYYRCIDQHTGQSCGNYKTTRLIVSIVGGQCTRGGICVAPTL